MLIKNQAVSKGINTKNMAKKRNPLNPPTLNYD